MKKQLIFSFAFLGEVGFSTAIPLALLAYVGRVLDQKFDSSPYFLLAGIGLASLFVFFYLKKLIKKAQNRIKDI